MANEEEGRNLVRTDVGARDLRFGVTGIGLIALAAIILAIVS